MDNAEFLLPSEIARLVYGQLRTMGCDEVSSKFLDLSPHLSECRELHKRNRSFNTEANGLSLKEILNQFLNMKKLILSAANTVDDSQGFKDPVEALNFMLSLGDVVNEESSSVVVNTMNQVAQNNPSTISSSGEEVFSDISLNLKTPDKSRSRKKISRKKLSSVHEEEHLSDRSEPETTSLLNKSTLKVPLIVLPRQSTRLQIKRASNNERLASSDGLKDYRKVPNDCETPCKIGKPPYSETKLQKPKISITLSSSDSETETTATTPKPNTTISEDLDCTKDSHKNNTVNGLFSPEPRKVTPKKKTLKVLRPRRPASSPLKRPIAANEKIRCKRDKGSAQITANESAKENRTEQPSEPSNREMQIATENEQSQLSPATSEELIFATDLSQNSEKSIKTRRKSNPSIQKDDEKTPSKQNKCNKSMIVIDDEGIIDKLIDNPKLHEHIAGNINKIVYSPQKKFNLNCKEEVENAVQEVVNTTGGSLIDEILKDLFGDDVDNLSEDQNSNLPSQPENVDNDNIYTVSFHNEPNQTQMTEITTVLLDDQTAIIDDDVSSYTSDRNAIIIQIPQEQSDQNNSLEQLKNFQKPLSSTEDIRSYLTFNADVTSSPDRHVHTKTDDNFITFSTESGEFIQSRDAGSENEKVYVNPNSILYPITEGMPLVIGQRTEFQMCGAPQITHKQKYVPIAPKPRSDPLNSEKISELGATQRGVATKTRRRTRGGRRPT